MKTLTIIFLFSGAISLTHGAPEILTAVLLVAGVLTGLWEFSKNK